MTSTLGELAALVDGRVVGNPDLPIYGAAPLRDARPGHITLMDGSERHRRARPCAASAAVVPPDAQPNGIAAIQVENVHHAFADILRFFRPAPSHRRFGISPLAAIGPGAQVADGVEIHPYATIADDVVIGRGTVIHAGVHVMAGSRIGEDVTIFPNAVLYNDTVVGPRCIIHAGAVLGAYGFGYEHAEGRHTLLAQLGNVVLEADVEIGAGTTVDRGTYGPTRIGEGTKVDNLVMIAHNCSIGRHNMLCSQVGIAGSTTTGDHVVMAGQVGVRDHVHIGHAAVLGAMAGVSNDVPDGQRVIGIPATPEREQKIKQAALSKLPEMRRQLKLMQRTVDRLVEQLAAMQNGSPAATGGPSDGNQPPHHAVR